MCVCVCVCVCERERESAHTCQVALNSPISLQSESAKQKAVGDGNLFFQLSNKGKCEMQIGHSKVIVQGTVDVGRKIIVYMRLGDR